MGTRNITIVQLNNKIKVAEYGQFDGYPSFTGVGIVEFCRRFKKPGYLDVFKDRVKQTSFLTNKELDKINKEGYDSSDSLKEAYPNIRIRSGFKILYYIFNSKAPIKSINFIDFAYESLFCEWGYVVNLDTEELEVYKGFNHDPLSYDDRFYKVNQKPIDDYYPIKLIKTYSFAKLPSKNKLVKDCDRCTSV